MTYPLVIRQTQLPARVVILRGRSLPYQQPEFGVEQRVQVNWTPGSPVGDAQVMGPMWLPTTFTGEWKDIFLFNDDSYAQLANFPALSSQATPNATERGGTSFRSAGSVPAQRAQRARALRDAFYLLAKEAVLLRVEWGSIVRYGFLKRFIPKPRREEDIPWEMEFEWIGETDAKPVRLQPKLELLSLLRALLAALDKIIDTLLTAIFKATMYITKVKQFITKIGAFVTALLEALKRITDFVFAPQDILQTIKANLVAVKLAAAEFHKSVAAAPSAAYETAVSGSPEELIMANLFQADWRRDLINMAADASDKIRQIDEYTAQRLLGVFAIGPNETLRDVAARETGNPENWRAIADFNGFESSVLPAGTVVRIPDFGGSG